MRYLQVLFIVSILLFTQNVYSNGAAWNPGNISGAPGPIKQNDLILIKEHVLFDDDPDDQERTVSAQFWIQNPTDKEIKVTMGFPLDYKEQGERSGWPAKEEAPERYTVKSLGIRGENTPTSSAPAKEERDRYIDNFKDKFKVSVEGIAVVATSTKTGTGPYTVVYTWEMSFPPRKTTEYSVEYPLAVSDRGADYGTDGDSDVGGSKGSRSFTYITHTGAYWARPIIDATFEYCSERLIKFIDSAPNGETTKVRETAQTYYSEREGWTVNPKPYEIDRENDCIVWTRKNWMPRKHDDDIKVTTYLETVGYNRKSPVEDVIDQAVLMKNWCGLAEDSKNDHLGQNTNITERELTPKVYNAIEKKAYTYPLYNDNKEFTSEFNKLSLQTQNDYHLLLSRYLRNYIFAIHGHVFKDDKLAHCFQNVQKSSTENLTGIEKKNVDWLLDYETQAKKQNAGTEIKKQTLK